MTTALQVAGNYLTTEKILSLDDIVVKGGRGEALGTVSMRFVEGKMPGLSVAFNVHAMEFPIGDDIGCAYRNVLLAHRAAELIDSVRVANLRRNVRI